MQKLEPRKKNLDFFKMQKNQKTKKGKNVKKHKKHKTQKMKFGHHFSTCIVVVSVLFHT